jgi:hypothetical protein
MTNYVDYLNNVGSGATGTSLRTSVHRLGGASDGYGAVIFAGGFTTTGFDDPIANTDYRLSDGTGSSLTDLYFPKGYIAAATAESFAVFSPGNKGGAYYNSVDYKSRYGGGGTGTSFTTPTYGGSAGSAGAGNAVFGGGASNPDYGHIVTYRNSSGGGGNGTLLRYSTVDRSAASAAGTIIFASDRSEGYIDYRGYSGTGSSGTSLRHGTGNKYAGSAGLNAIFGGGYASGYLSDIEYRNNVGTGSSGPDMIRNRYAGVCATAGKG